MPTWKPPPDRHDFVETITSSVDNVCGSCGRTRAAVCHTGLSDVSEPHTYTGREHPGTSYGAAALVAPRSGSQRDRVRHHIGVQGDHGSMDCETAAALGLAENSVRPRRLELQEGGWVMDSGLRRVVNRVGARSTTHGIVWVLTPVGRAAWEAER